MKWKEEEEGIVLSLYLTVKEETVLVKRSVHASREEDSNSHPLGLTLQKGAGKEDGKKRG